MVVGDRSMRGGKMMDEEEEVRKEGDRDELLRSVRSTLSEGWAIAWVWL
jgi:hypothetical protein